MYLFRLPNLVDDIRYRVLHSTTKIRMRIIGNNIVRDVLNISLEGAKNLISLSLMNQSNDRKASEGDPKISMEPKMSVKLSGNFRFNEYAEAISWR